MTEMTWKAQSTRIILARHGQTEWNKEHRFQGRTDVALTEEGKAQAEALSARLASTPLDAVFTSPLSRALWTAQEVARPHNLEPEILTDLTEINFGTWEGQSIPQLQANSRTAWSSWRADPFFNPPAGAETWERIYSRLTRAVRAVLEEKHSTAAIISHGGIIRALLAVLCGLNPHKVWNIDVSNCSITAVELRHGRPCLLFTNDDMHVRSELGRVLPVFGDDNVKL